MRYGGDRADPVHRRGGGADAADLRRSSDPGGAGGDPTGRQQGGQACSAPSSGRSASTPSRCACGSWYMVPDQVMPRHGPGPEGNFVAADLVERCRRWRTAASPRIRSPSPTSSTPTPSGRTGPRSPRRTSTSRGRRPEHPRRHTRRATTRSSRSTPPTRRRPSSSSPSRSWTGRTCSAGPCSSS